MHAQLEPAPTTPVPLHDPLCRVCRMGPGIAAQHEAEADGLASRGHHAQAQLSRERAAFWRKRVERCGATQ